MAVPGGGDGVGPAWSPDGEWIAFSRLERADSSQAVCLFMALGVACAQERIDYSPGERVLTIIRPDGSGVTELGEGDEPAWSPEGDRIAFSSDRPAESEEEADTAFVYDKYDIFIMDLFTKEIRPLVTAEGLQKSPT